MNESEPVALLSHEPKQGQIDSFDYAIVGTASAGRALANRLSEDGKSSICLPEAGPRD